MKDLGLICILIEKEPDIAIHVSSLTGVLTNSAALFFKRLGVQCIVFAVILRRRPSSILLTGRGRVWNIKYLFLDLAV
ncbi:U32 family peptidase [Desulfitobacterium sp. AusDCA]|uniref:U32 family peptidase n=1 Tax=Desulfitobacterium sp. AusDCA TaxID=3240383 RepID=UPI003DA79CD1